MKEKIFKLTLKDFARFIGTSVNDIPKDCRELIAKFDSRHWRLNQAERDKVILGILKRIDSLDLSVSGEKNKKNWEKCWKENLQNFIEKDYDVTELVPEYIRPNQPVRLYRDYILPRNPLFELRWFEVFRSWIFKKYLKEIEAIYEFGCGTGYNLVALAKLFPEKKLYGLDWIKASVEIINLIGKKHGFNIKGQVFDMFSPDKNLNFSNNSAVLTIDALEQIGPNFEEFLRFLLKKSPSLCLNIEPIRELYDENNLIDYLAIKFHKKRNYLDGYLNRLYQLRDEGKVEIINTQRVLFGSLYHDAYSYIVWKPK